MSENEKRILILAIACCDLAVCEWLIGVCGGDDEDGERERFNERATEDMLSRRSW